MAVLADTIVPKVASLFDDSAEVEAAQGLVTLVLCSFSSIASGRGKHVA
jgi:hypothetical protein